MVSEISDCCSSSSNDSLPSTSAAATAASAKESYSDFATTKQPVMDAIILNNMNDDVENVFTWAMCPIGSGQVFSILIFIIVYSVLFLFFAQHSTLMLIIMTGIIATWTIILYATGIICIVYMILRDYPPPPIADFDGITFSKLCMRLSLEMPQQQPVVVAQEEINTIIEYKI